MFARWLLPLTLFTSAASLVASAHLADALADVAVERLIKVSRLLPTPKQQVELELDESPPILAAVPLASPKESTKKRLSAKQAGPRSLFVSAPRVLAIAQSGARPRGKPVPATAKRPAGLRLSGVSALGVGLLDGDVLTEAAGAPALDSGAVIGAVLRARAGQAKTISGTCYRGDERFSLVVEQPYLPAPGQGQTRP